MELEVQLQEVLNDPHFNKCLPVIVPVKKNPRIVVKLLLFSHNIM